MKEPEIFAAIKKHHRAGEWVVLPQQRDGTGFESLRTADAIAINCWPSRGMQIHGFEIKSYRGDWIRELRDPKKAESIFRYCDHWWIVCAAPFGDHEIVHIQEVPATWGFMTVDEAGRVKVQKSAPQLEPVQLDRTFIASILRNFEKHETPEAELKRIKSEEYERGYKAGQKEERSRGDMRDQIGWRRSELRDLEKSAKNILKRIQEGLKEMSEAEPEGPPNELVMRGGIR